MPRPVGRFAAALCGQLLLTDLELLRPTLVLDEVGRDLELQVDREKIQLFGCERHRGARSVLLGVVQPRAVSELGRLVPGLGCQRLATHQSSGLTRGSGASEPEALRRVK